MVPMPIRLAMPFRVRCVVVGVALLLVPTMSRAQARPVADEQRADSLMKARDFAAAYAAYDALATASPTDGKLWYQLGMAAAQLGRYADGVRAFGRAADITRGPAAMYNAGAMHARLGHTDSAYAWLGRAAASGFSDEKLLRTDEDLASLRGTARFDSLVYRATHAPTPCAREAERRRLDFWTGEWDVTTAGGSPAGTSSVQIVSDGCALLESWSSTRGGRGHSLTTFNPAVGQWQQYWIGQDGNPIEYRESAWRDGSIALRASFAASGNAPATELRLTFSPIDSSTVRQHGERSTDGGRTWSTTYDFLYHRRR
jgi:tetratricopeptide (TPR) repeat protein